MKKALVVLVILWASPALAQETYSFSATAGNVSNFIDPARVTANEQACNAAGLALDCTEAQLQAVPGYEQERVYPDSLQGRNDYIEDKILRPAVPGLKDVQRAWDKDKARLAWDALNRAGKNAVCSALGLPAGCELY